MSAFSAVNVERSTRLHAIVKEIVDAAKPARTDAVPRAGAIVSRRMREFKMKLARSRLYFNCVTTLQQAHAFALGVTNGLGGDRFQNFLGKCAEWSALVKDMKTHAAQSVTLSEFEDVFRGKFSIDFTGLLLPVHSPLDGHAVLLFSWLEDDLSPTSGELQVIYIACLVRIVRSNDVLASIREVLTADDKAKQPALCELIPRHWLFGESPANTVRLADEVVIPYDRVAAFGKAALLQYVTHAYIDGSIFAAIDKEMDAIERDREARKRMKKSERL